LAQKLQLQFTVLVFGATVGGDRIRILQRSLAAQNQSPWAIVWR